MPGAGSLRSDQPRPMDSASPRPGVDGAPEADVPESDDPQYVALRADVTARIRPVCADMTPEAFDVLVRDIGATTRRWAGRSAP